MLGKEGMRKYLINRKKKGDSWTGTFSNLGVWTIPNGGSWVICPNVPYMYPIGAACITVNGRLSISLQLHPALGNDSDARQALVDSWKNACLNSKSVLLQEA